MKKSEEFEVIFLGGLFPKNFFQSISKNSIGPMQIAANNLQWELVKGLEANLGKKITIINSLFVGSYPMRYKKMFIKSFEFSHSTNSKSYNIGFINLPLIKQISRTLNLKLFLRKYIKNNRKKIILIGYSMSIPITSTMRYIKKINPDSHTHLVIPDLPDFMNFGKNNNLFFLMLKSIFNLFLIDDIRFIDSFTLLTKYMKSYLKISHDKPCVIIEGIIPSHRSKKLKYNLYKTKYILYSGGIYEEYGVLDLLKAFKKTIGHKYELRICGSGDSNVVNEIIKETKLDCRIKFMGVLNKEDLINIQQCATLLINPRKADKLFTKYSFPSKNLEYMNSGRPFIGYFLEGMPNEYKGLFIEISKNGIYDTLNFAFSLDEDFLQKLGKKAKDFVKKNKNNKTQTKKILNIIGI